LLLRRNCFGKRTAWLFPDRNTFAVPINFLRIYHKYIHKPEQQQPPQLWCLLYNLEKFPTASACGIPWPPRRESVAAKAITGSRVQVETPVPPVLREEHFGKETPASVPKHSARATFPAFSNQHSAFSGQQFAGAREKTKMLAA
jgi:hypothetical protein